MKPRDSRKLKEYFKDLLDFVNIRIHKSTLEAGNLEETSSALPEQLSFMKPRDSRKSKEYFKDLLDFVNIRIRKSILEAGNLEETSSTLPEQLSLSKYSTLLDTLIKQVNIEYSIGTSVEDTTKSLVDVLNLLSYKGSEECIQGYKRSLSSYDTMVKLLSFAFLMKLTPQSEFLNALSEENFDDDILLGVLSAAQNQMSVLGDRMATYAYFDYWLLTKALRITDKSQQTAFLNEYLDHYVEVRRGGLLMGPPDPHERDDLSYVGYWAFEVAALVIILQLDDTSLSQSPYYPKELVDYYWGAA